jgi:hypothetical protein
MKRRELVDQSSRNDIAASVCEGLSSGDAGVMRLCISRSVQLYRGEIDGEIICVFGLMPPTLLSDRAYLWMWHNEKIKEHSFVVIRESQLAVEEMLRDYAVLVGHCHRDRPQSRKWLRWLGAEFGQADGTRVPFEIRRK